MAHLLGDEDAMTIYLGCPDLLGGKAGNLVLPDFYNDLLDWRRGEAYGDFFLARRSKFRLGFNGSGWSDVRPPRWPDPAHPQQPHLDILVSDLDAYGELVIDRGATVLQAGDRYRIYAGPDTRSASIRTRPARRRSRSPETTPIKRFR